MSKKENDFWEWIKAHKVQLFFAGISVVTVSAAILRIKDQETFERVWKMLKESVSFKQKLISEADLVTEISTVTFEKGAVSHTYVKPSVPVDVHQHIRNLSNGRHHSVEKAMEAAKLGIPLLPSQTIVDSYTKHSQAA